jgi:NADPH-dependent curcumin reductase CurA
MEQIDELKKELINHGKTVFFDCVGGNFAGQVFNILPPNSTMINYGRLSK